MIIQIKKPNLTNYQEKFLYNDSRFTVTEASTKAGKTFAHLWWIFEQAHADWNKPGYNHWWVAPLYGQSKIAFNRLKLKVIRSGGAYKINNTALTISCPNGAIIHFKTAKDPDALFGEDVYSVVFDEAPRAKEAAWHVLRTTITATRGKMKLIGNFGGSSNWMHLLKEKAKTDPEYSYHKVTAWQAVDEGILDREEIEQAQKDLPSKVFMQLYMAEAQEENDMLCTYASIKDLWTNTHAVKGTRYISADIALHGSDKFKIGVWDGLVLIHYVTIDKCDAPEVTAIIKKLAEEYKVKRSNIVYDADGLGAFLRGYLQGAVPFNNGGAPIQVSSKTKINYKNIKSQCGYKLAEKINAGEMYIECETDKKHIMQELECLQSYELDREQKIQIMPKKKVKERIGRSPDDLDMLLMRMRFELKVKGKGPMATNVSR